MSSMNMHTKARASMSILQAGQCTPFVRWLTIIKMQSWPFPEIGRSVMKSMPNLCQWPLAIGCGRPMGFPLWWLVRWHGSQPAMYRCVLPHIYIKKYRSFIRKYVQSAPKCPAAGVSWASRTIHRCIILGIHNHPLTSAFPSSSFSFALAASLTCVISKSPRNHSRPFSSK